MVTNQLIGAKCADVGSTSTNAGAADWGASATSNPLASPDGVNQVAWSTADGAAHWDAAAATIDPGTLLADPLMAAIVSLVCLAALFVAGRSAERDADAGGDR